MSLKLAKRLQSEILLQIQILTQQLNQVRILISQVVGYNLVLEGGINMPTALTKLMAGKKSMAFGIALTILVGCKQDG